MQTLIKTVELRQLHLELLSGYRLIVVQEIQLYI